MIDRIEIKGFKRFSHQEFDVCPLTILTGLNGSGKTSLIHSLLLVHDSIHGAGEGTVRLNGPFGLELGTAGDVVNWESPDDICFGMSEGVDAYTWKFRWTSDDSMHLVPDQVPVRFPTAFRGLPNSFAYLAAERYGPRGSFEASPLPEERLEIGARGENCAQILEMLGNKPLREDRLHPHSTAPSLLKYEVERWLSEIARPVEIDASRYPGSIVYSLNFRVPGGIWVRSTNMGFGVSYALPIILTGLTLQEGGLLIVENPEAHLHPAGQSRMGFFLAWLAEKGIQVIVETHSDHVLNGIRRAIGEYGILKSDQAIVHFFETEDRGAVTPLAFTAIGGVSHWPKGFFDQYQIDTAALGRVRRGGGR